jgi:hypothetical protein
MKAFNKMLTGSVDGSLLSGFSVGSRHSGVVTISHKLFADDTLVFVGPILITFAICGL